MRLCAAVLSLALTAALFLAQSNAAPMWADVVVLDGKGVPVRDLTLQDFVLFEDGEARPIQRFIPAGDPWNVLLLFDHNLTWLRTEDAPGGTAYVMEMWRLMAQGIERFLAHLRAEDRIAVAVFQEKVEVLLNWRNARTGRTQEVKMNPVVQRPAGQRDLYGAIEWTLANMKAIQGRKAAIVFTDGRDGRLSPQWFQNDDGKVAFDPFFGLPDHGEAAEFSKTLEAVKQSGIRLYFVAVNISGAPVFGADERPISGIFPGVKQEIANYQERVQRRLERLAETSGGRVFYESTPQEAISRYEVLYRDLALFDNYTLEYSPAIRATEIETAPHTLTVRARSGVFKTLVTRPYRSQ